MIKLMIKSAKLRYTPLSHTFPMEPDSCFLARFRPRLKSGRWNFSTLTKSMICGE